MNNMAIFVELRPHARLKLKCSPLTKGLLWGGALSILLWATIGWMAVKMF